MKIIYPIVGLLGTVLFFSCSSDHRSTNKNGDTTAVPGDTTASTMIPAPAPTNAIPYSDSTGNEKTVNLVKASLTRMFKDELSKKLIDEQSRKFRLFEHNLNKDPEKEIFVGLTGSNFCGSGGCTVLLLSPKGELITRFTVTGDPILIADTKTKGWNDLILHSNGKDHLMKFDGKTYPSNPSTQPVYTSSTSQTLVKGLEATDQLYTW